MPSRPGVAIDDRGGLGAPIPNWTERWWQASKHRGDGDPSTQTAAGAADLSAMFRLAVPHICQVPCSIR
jgi:hypothetical protein